ncbi:hypothetical protein FN846DRAFT_903414 [Sphaerosporella brunnea]|uniref:Uncharacterized protein n=1 Tax=Sphaerosporella brunnea TaxID=1250544 RepID=A0A5J5F790_9PEZI|nr:hypothetical protein FN846DRAFT_903414 [Sphaerosporella brunnea]
MSGTLHRRSAMDALIPERETLREEIKLSSLPTPQGERRAFIYSAAWAKQQEKGQISTTENGTRNLDPRSPPEILFQHKSGGGYWCRQAAVWVASPRIKELKHVVEGQLDIDRQSVLDSRGNRIDETHWPVVRSSWPYYTDKFTVLGASLFSDSLYTMQFKDKRLTIKLAVPRPHNLTVSDLVSIAVAYIGQLQMSGELAVSTFIAVQTLNISQVRLSIGRRFFEALGIDDDDWTHQIRIAEHDVVVRTDDGNWIEVSGPDNPTLGSLQISDSHL